MQKISLKDLLPYIKEHKKLLITILVIAISGGFFLYGNRVPVEEVVYVTEDATHSFISETVSGAGQVEVSDQFDVKPQVAGTVTSIAVTKGQEVKVGDLIAVLDNSDAGRDLRDALTELETSELELAELIAPVDELDLLQAEHSLADARRSLENANQDYDELQSDSEQSLVDTYEDGYSEISNAFLKLPDYVNDLQDVLGTEDLPEEYVDDYKLILTGADESFVDDLVESYDIAYNQYESVFAEFRRSSRGDTREEIYALLESSVIVSRSLSDTLEDARNMLDEIVTMSYESKSISSVIDAMRPVIKSDISGINSLINTLQGIQDEIDDTVYHLPLDLDKALEDIANAEETLAEKELTYERLIDGPDALDVRAKEIEVDKKRDAVSDARELVADHYLRAQIDGIVANIDVGVGDTVNTSATAATIITAQHLATIALNEVDIVRVELGQKSSISFNALTDLTLTGEVVDVDTLGTVSQGVVSYDVTVMFDTQDERIKPGMSIFVDVVVAVDPNALVVPSVAVKFQGEERYVEVLQSGVPVRKQVQTGIVSTTHTQIIEGLQEGDAVVTQTKTGSASVTQSSSGGSVLPGMSMPGSGSGARK